MTGPKKKSKGIKRKNNLTKTRRIEDIAKDFDKTTFEIYGQVTKTLGNRRFGVNIQNIDNPSEIIGNIVCSIKGSFRRKIVVDMYVLVKLFDFNQEQGQIIDGYTPDEIQALKASDKWDYPICNLDNKTSNDIDMPEDSDSDTDSEPETNDITVQPTGEASAAGQEAAAADEFDIDAI